MKNRLDRQLPGSVDAVTESLLQTLRQQGLQPEQADTGEDDQVRTVVVTDPAAVANATDADPDAAPIGTASISIRQAGDEVHISLIEPLAKATLTGDEDLLEPGQQLQTAIIRALESLAAASEPQDGEGNGKQQVGDPTVRQALLDAIHQTTTSLPDMDTQARADTLFVLAKAYTAIVSLERTEEVELHLA